MSILSDGQNASVLKQLSAIINSPNSTEQTLNENQVQRMVSPNWHLNPQMSPTFNGMKSPDSSTQQQRIDNSELNIDTKESSRNVAGTNQKRHNSNIIPAPVQNQILMGHIDSAQDILLDHPIDISAGSPEKSVTI